MIHGGQINTTPAELAVYISQMNGGSSGGGGGGGGPTEPTVPDPPTDLVAIPRNNALKIEFTPGSDGGSEITTYLYSTDGENYMDLNTDSSPLLINYAIRNGYTYTIYLKAVNAIGTSIASASVTGTPAPPTVPDQPTSLCVIPSDSALTILFILGSDGGSDITNYQYSTDNGANFTAFSPAQTDIPVIITGLTNGTIYTVRLKAVNAVGAGIQSASVTAAPIPNAFDPSDITGLILWLDAQVLGNVDQVEGSVRNWLDSTELSNDFAASPTGIITYSQPSRINDRPALNFTTGATIENSASTYLSRTFNIAPSNQMTLFMVLEQTAVGTGNSELFSVSGPANAYKNFDLFNYTLGNSNLSLNLRNTISGGNPLVYNSGSKIITSPSSTSIITTVVSTSNASVYVNGTVTSINATAVTGTSLSNGAFTWMISGASFLGDIGEVISYSSALGDTDRQVIEGYLAWKWGLQGSLDAGNPYKSSPPTSTRPPPGAPTLLFILPGNTNAYVYYRAGTGLVTNYEYTGDDGTNFTACSPADIISPSQVTGLTNGTAVTIKFRAVNAGGNSAKSNGISITPSNPSVPAADLYFDPNDNSCWTGTTVTSIGTIPSIRSGALVGSVTRTTGTGISRKVFNLNGGYIPFVGINFGSNFTISAWVYPKGSANPTAASASYNINAIITNGTPGAYSPGFKFGWNNWISRDRNLLFENGNSTSWTVPGSVNNVVVMNTWQYLTMIFDQSSKSVVFLINGTPVNVVSITTSTNVLVNEAWFNIGSYIGGSYQMYAELGMLKVFKTGLTAGQVLADYNATKAGFGL